MRWQQVTDFDRWHRGGYGPGEYERRGGRLYYQPAPGHTPEERRARQLITAATIALMNERMTTIDARLRELGA